MTQGSPRKEITSACRKKVTRLHHTTQTGPSPGKNNNSCSSSNRP
jgi:hypothetical protein